MKKLFLATLLAGLASVQVASALTITFDSPIPVAYSFDDAQIVQGTGSNSLGQYATPFGDATKYLAVQRGGTATFNWPSLQTSLSLTWGSVDNYNFIQFYNGTNLVGTFSGTDVMPGANGNQGPDGTVTVPLTPGSLFNSIKLVDTNSDAFEVDNITTNAATVPDGGTTAALLGLAMVIIVAVRSKLSLA